MVPSSFDNGVVPPVGDSITERTAYKSLFRVISTLSIYVWHLFEGRSVRDLH
jgi:hypothetical protein